MTASPFRGLLIGCALGLLMWAAIVGLVCLVTS